jgi:hypothetical protein
MADIIEFLIKYRFVIRSPISPTGNHLYGMASYLVPRSNPNSLGRLIVDYSPINSLIESPANVIPEVGSTLQYLQGKALFSGINLRYTFLGLRIDPESPSLTTFLTPDGSFQWAALPTGAANSPAFFSNFLTKCCITKSKEMKKGIQFINIKLRCCLHEIPSRKQQITLMILL